MKKFLYSGKTVDKIFLLVEKVLTILKLIGNDWMRVAWLKNNLRLMRPALDRLCFDQFQ